MSGLFGAKTIEPEEPATMPDPDDVERKRSKRVSSTVTNGAKTPARVEGGTIGREYSRGTLG